MDTAEFNRKLVSQLAAEGTVGADLFMQLMDAYYEF